MSFRMPMFLLGLSALSATAALAQDIDYALINSSSAIVMEFYTSPVDDDSWGDDLLGANVIMPGTEGIVTIADGETNCVYDMMFVFDDGSEFTDTVDICELASYELTD